MCTPHRRVNAWNPLHDAWALEFDCPKCGARRGQVCKITPADQMEWPSGWQTHLERVSLTGCDLPAGGEIYADPLRPYPGGHFESKRSKH